MVTKNRNPLTGPNEESIRRVLATNPAFAACKPETKTLLLAAASTRRYQAEEMICARGEPIVALMVVICGSVEVGLLAASGQRYVRWFLEPGQILGIAPLIDGKGAIYDSRAHGDTTLLEIPRGDFLQAMEADSGLALAVIKALCQRSRSLHETAAADALLPMRARVARMILMLAEAYGLNRPAGIVISLKLSQDEFAALLAVSRQRLNKELKGLEAEGCIAISYSTLTVLDLVALQAVAQSGDPA